MLIKVRKFDHDWDVPLPARMHYNDAGADVCTAEAVTLKPHETRRIPLGFGLELPDGLMACVFPRSGKSCEGIVCELPPIDSGYTGEVHAIVSNLTGTLQKIPGGTRVGQLVVMPVVLADFVADLGDERGDDGFGSTGDSAATD